MSLATPIQFHLMEILLIALLFERAVASLEKYDPCCSFPCQHNSVCLSRGPTYECDCMATGYYGNNCETPTWGTTMYKMLKPSRETLQYLLTNFKPVWDLVNRVPALRKKLMKTVLMIRTHLVPEPSPYHGTSDYTTLDGYFNKTVYRRTLPAVPLHCPTPMGVKGKARLPDVDLLVEELFRRRKFKPCPRRTSLLFPFFAQHFTHMFFRADSARGFPFQLGNQAVDLSNVYGVTADRRRKLRTGVNGTLRHSTIDGEVYPPLADEIGDEPNPSAAPDAHFAMASEHFFALPTMFVFATLWLREHNRLCAVLLDEHPTWDDERVYQTAKLILTGETIKVVIEDYVQHLSGFHFRLAYAPEVLHDVGFSYHNDINLEFQILYHWHALMPDAVRMRKATYEWGELLFNFQPFLDAGFDAVLSELSRQLAGQVAGGRNQGYATLAVAKRTILDSREVRMQSFNRYREKFGMEPLTSFQQLTGPFTPLRMELDQQKYRTVPLGIGRILRKSKGETEFANKLKQFYGDIDALEFYVGVILEASRPSQLFGETMTEIGAPYSLKGLMGNPIGSPAWWKPSTFGGQRGFDIVKSTNLQDLVCRNTRTCPEVSFRVPDGQATDVQTAPTTTDVAGLLRKKAQGHGIHEQIQALRGLGECSNGNGDCR